jgi:hypothetical protein
VNTVMKLTVSIKDGEFVGQLSDCRRHLEHSRSLRYMLVPSYSMLELIFLKPHLAQSYMKIIVVCKV